MKQLQRCPLCQKDILSSSNYQHIEQDCPLKDSVTQICKTYFICNDTQYYCFRCLEVFNQVTWLKHRKKIRILCLRFAQQNSKNEDEIQMIPEQTTTKRISFSTPSKSKKEISLGPKQQNSLKSWPRRNERSFAQSDYYYSSIKEVLKFNQFVELTDTEKLALLFIEMFISKAKLLLVQWIKANKSISPIHLQLFFGKYIDKCLGMLKNQIKEPSFQLLNSKLKANWRQIFQNPTDIFERSKILEKMENLRPTVKLKIIRCLNSLYKKEYHGIFDSLPVNFYEPMLRRNKLPVRTFDFLLMLKHLMLTRQKSLVHIAIDLLLIFQSAQRFRSDRHSLQEGAQKIIKSMNNEERTQQFQMKINKTKKNVKVILGQQLCKLLEAFNWSRFYRNGSLYFRMSRIFGFSLYSLKRGLLSQFSLQEKDKIDLDIKTLAGHQKLMTTQIYTQDARQWIIQKIKDNIKIPDLKIETASQRQVLEKLGKGSIYSSKYLKINEDWLQKLRSQLKNYNKEVVDFCAESIDQPLQQNLNRQAQQKQVGYLSQIAPKHIPELPKQPMNQTQEAVIIMGSSYSYRNEKFNEKDLFYHLENLILSCKKCKIKDGGGKACIFCNSCYHECCLPKFCFCSESPYNIFSGIQMTSSIECTQIIEFPEKYFGDQQENIELNNIKFLLKARRFYYTTTQIEPFPLKYYKQWNIKNIQKIQFKKFSHYQQGRYFPPLKLKISGFQTLSGTGFGLFAKNDIKANCFIGEYAADIVNSSIAFRIRRPDSIFELIQSLDDEEGVVLGPIFHCSYACLINSSQGRTANCQSLKIIVNGALRVIIFTKCKIKKGEQLCYDYSEEVQKERKRTNEKNKVNKQIGQEQLQWLSNLFQDNAVTFDPNKNVKCGLTNSSQCCYFNSIFQLMNLFPALQNRNIGVCLVMAGLFKNMRQNKLYNPRKYHEYFQRISDNKFQVNHQNDSHQFLIFLFSFFDQALSNKFLIVSDSIDVCQSCSFSKNQKIKYLTYNIQASQSSLLELFSGEKEYLVEQFYCDKCQKRGFLKRKQKIVQFPQFFIVHLQRYRREDKDRTSINYYEVGSSLYQVVAVVVHLGNSIYSGHYFTVQIVNETSSILFDDDKVSQSTLTFFEDAYILVYKLKKK